MIAVKSFQKSLLPALAFLMFFFAACDAATQAAGKVKDQNGQQLGDVIVTMESSGNESGGGFKKEAEQTTKPDGTYNFVTVTGAATKARLTFAKEGYKTRQIDIKANEENVVDVVLEPDIK